MAAAFTAIPQGVILHGSRSGSGNDTAAEYRGTANYAASGIELGWNATIGDDIYAIHMPCDRWGWNARAASQRYLAVEFAQATADRPISDAQVNAFCHWFEKEARRVWPGLALVFPTHAELPEGQGDGKTDVFPRGDQRADELRARIVARLGFSVPSAVEGEASPTPAGGKLWDGVTRYTLEADHPFRFADELWPLIQRYAARYEVSPRILAGIVRQEAGAELRNWRVHMDGHGHGLVGLDDGGLLGDFEAWAKLSVGRGATAAIIPIEAQLEFTAYMLRRFQDYYADDPELEGRSKAYVGARAWHAGGGKKYPEAGWDGANGLSRNGPKGVNYERLVREKIEELGI